MLLFLCLFRFIFEFYYKIYNHSCFLLENQTSKIKFFIKKIVIFYYKELPLKTNNSHICENHSHKNWMN
jgi:hypothetical protein